MSAYEQRTSHDAYLSELFSLNGRTALVTGASAGLGAEMAFALSRAGAEIVLVARRADRLHSVRDRIRQAGGSAHVLAADFMADEAIEHVSSEAAALGVDIDILINAAGVNIRKAADQLRQSDWDDVVRLNLKVPFFLAQQFAPGMARRFWGRILNIASLQSVRALPNSIPYGASKGGVVQLTRAMAEAWSAQGVCCNAIAPGLFPTELTAPLYGNPQMLAEMAARTCVGRNGELPDIAGLTVFLASEASGFVTGQTIFLDGGLTAR